MRWTKDPDVEKDQYWWFKKRGCQPTVVHIRLVINLLYAFFPDGRREAFGNLKGEWAGPLEEPEAREHE